ncbi:hypothetical protein ACF0H5_001777 [Mactra antiquata]
MSISNSLAVCNSKGWDVIKDGTVEDVMADIPTNMRESLYHMSLLNSLQHNPAMLKTCKLVMKALFPVTCQRPWTVSHPERIEEISTSLALRSTFKHRRAKTSIEKVRFLLNDDKEKLPKIHEESKRRKSFSNPEKIERLKNLSDLIPETVKARSSS